jgi:hypothetical protein
VTFARYFQYNFLTQSYLTGFEGQQVEATYNQVAAQPAWIHWLMQPQKAPHSRQMLMLDERNLAFAAGLRPRMVAAQMRVRQCFNLGQRH